MNTIKGFVILLVLAAVSGNVSAINLIWRGDLYAPDDYWGSLGNWRLGDAETPATALPTANDTAYLIFTTAYVVAPGAIAGNVVVGKDWGFIGQLDVEAGGALSIPGSLEINWNQGYNGFVNVKGGSLTVGNGFVGAVNGVNNAYLNVYSGNLTVTGVLHMNYWGTSNGSFDIYGGTATIGNLAMDAGGTTTLHDGTLITYLVTVASATQGLFDFRGGQWIIGSVSEGTFGYWVNSGIVKVNGQVIDINDGTLRVSTTLNPGYLTVKLNDGSYTCPEPLMTDLNDDCVVNIQDLVILVGQWLNCNRVPQTECP